jgi:cytochrome oxidase Cu insertion factor (SCO1/SenC/PrrC family)
MLHRMLVFLVLVLVLPAAAQSSRADDGHGVSGPADAYVYPLAAPGTYRLPVIRKAADAWLLDETASPRRLADLFRGHVTLMAFIYTRCADLCPLAGLRMADVQALAAEDAAATARLRLISLSFDPAYDTPARMADLAAHLRVPDVDRPDWIFLTAASEAAIRPLLRAYDQPVSAKPDAADDDDDAFGPFSHLLRVFLIDADARVRNIYSADFLDPRLVMNDVRTVLGESGEKGEAGHAR